MRWKADLALAGITFIWGATFVLVKNALDDASTILFLAMRFGLAGALLLLLARRVRLTRDLAVASAAVGACMFFGYLFQTAGLRLTTPSKSAFITGMFVVLVPVFTGLFLRRFPGLWAAGGVGAAGLGLYFLTAPTGTESVNRGDLLTLACAAIFALHIILTGHFIARLPAIGLTAGQVVVTALLSLASLPWAERVFLRLSPALVVAVLVTAVFATAVAFFVQTWAQQYTSPTHTALIFALEPVFAWLTSWAVEGERLGGRAAVGALLILAGIVLAEAPWRRIQ